MLLDHPTPDAGSINAAIESSTESLLSAKRQKAVQDYVERRREELLASGRLVINSSLVLSGT